MNDNKKKFNREPKKLYEDKIISIGKVTKVTQGGRNFRFSATVAVVDSSADATICAALDRTGVQAIAAD